MTQLIDAAETIYSALMDTKLTAVERSALARALCDVDKRIRAWKGLPDPAPARLDGLPLKHVHIRRGKGMPILEVAAHAQQFTEALTTGNQAAGEPTTSAGPEVNATEIETRATPAAQPAKKRNPFEKLKREREAKTTPKSEGDKEST